VAASLVAFSLLAVLTISLASAANAKGSGARAASAPRVYTPTAGGPVTLGGVVNLAKLPTIPAGTKTTAPPPPQVDPLTPAQRQAYWNSRKATPGAPTVTPGAHTTTTSGLSPSFVGGGVNPLLVKSVDGLDSAQTATTAAPNPAIAVDLSYVMEGVDGGIAIYSAASGAKLYGPYSPASFFAPVHHATYFFTNPQLYYDVMRDRWIVAYLEYSSFTPISYLDVAVSQTTSPTQPTPGGQYNIYQFATNFAPLNGVRSQCTYPTLGVDYWAIYFTCINDRGGAFVGNTQIAINKGPMLSGATTNLWTLNDAMTTNPDRIYPSGQPAFRLSPAIEEGIQDAEFFVSVDSGYGTASQNLGVCAWKNMSTAATTMPSISCLNHNLTGAYYKDPPPARQPGGPNTIATGYGMKQVYYKAGRLFLALPTALDIKEGPGDGIWWMEVQPVFDFLPDPTTIYTVLDTQISLFFYGTMDTYMPTLIGTDEDDLALVFNSSGPSMYPGIGMVGRKASDRPGIMDGGSGAFVTVASGAHVQTSGAWGGYSSCAIALNSVTRGTIWCAAEYVGSVGEPGWNTRLFSFRTE
jgi:hypothetical protein